MIDPHTLPIPDDPIDRVHALARDLAYGVMQNQFPPHIDINHTRIAEFLRDRWKGKQPNIMLLVSFGYLVQNPIPNPNNPTLDLTQKAFELLEKPSERPQVFIAYGTQESSAFGLAIEYRLESFDVPVFIDRSIPLGEDWDNHLIERIQQSKYMLCLLAPGTLVRSTYICKEIKLAKETNGCTFISIQHDGFNPDQDFGTCFEELKQFVKSKQFVKVDGTTAKAYHDAVEEVLNQLWIPSRK
jgi:hypothetical protein